jgi:hypothetical protein
MERSILFYFDQNANCMPKVKCLKINGKYARAEIETMNIDKWFGANWSRSV